MCRIRSIIFMAFAIALSAYGSQQNETYEYSIQKNSESGKPEFLIAKAGAAFKSIPCYLLNGFPSGSSTIICHQADAKISLIQNSLDKKNWAGTAQFYDGSQKQAVISCFESNGGLTCYQKPAVELPNPSGARSAYSTGGFRYPNDYGVYFTKSTGGVRLNITAQGTVVLNSDCEIQTISAPSMGGPSSSLLVCQPTASVIQASLSLNDFGEHSFWIGTITFNHQGNHRGEYSCYDDATRTGHFLDCYFRPPAEPPPAGGFGNNG